MLQLLWWQKAVEVLPMYITLNHDLNLLLAVGIANGFKQLKLKQCQWKLYLWDINYYLILISSDLTIMKLWLELNTELSLFWSCILHSLQWYFWLVCMGRNFARVLRSGIRVWLTLLDPSCTCLMPIIIFVVVIPVSCLLCWSQLGEDCGDFLHCSEVCTDLFYFLCDLHQWKIQYEGHWQWVCQWCCSVTHSDCLILCCVQF